MPYRWRLRRYGLPHNRFDDLVVPVFTWCLVQIEFPDGWIDGDDAHALVVGGTGDEPSYCPWCGKKLDKSPGIVRGTWVYVSEVDKKD